MQLSLLITAHCNAQCAHCSTACGPDRAGQDLATTDLLQLMTEAAAQDTQEPPQFAFSGGEPFLDLPRLCLLFSHARDLGASMISCVSNASWASSDSKARGILERVREAGLTTLAISSSQFHEQYIKRQRVERALRLANEFGLETCLKYVLRADDPRERDEVIHWAAALGTTDVEFLPLMHPVRPGASIPQAAIQRYSDLPEGPCPAAVITVLEDGQVYPCCTPGINTPLHRLGQIKTTSLERIIQRFEQRGTQQILRETGPIAFAEEIQRRGLGDKLWPAYANACELCSHISGDVTLAQVAHECGEQREREQIENLFERLREHRLANAG